MKRTYCVQPFSGSGHHDAYADMYCETFLELGHAVVLLCKGPERVLSPAIRSYEEKGLFHVIWNGGGETCCAPHAASVPQRHPFERMARRCVASAWRAIRLAAAKLLFILPPLRVHRGGPVWPSRELLQRAAKQYGRPDLVFFLYADLYIQHFPDVLSGVPYPWAGLLFDAASLQKETGYYLDRALRSPHAAGLCFLDPRYMSQYKRKYPAKHFVVLPDVPDASLAAEEPAYCGAIREKAAGRQVVLLAGSLAARKGMITLLRLAAQPEAARYYFAFVGKFLWEAFAECSAEDKKFVADALANPPENCFFHFDYIAEESSFNRLFPLADIVYAVYERFDLSSGIVGKAAMFQRPILVQKGGLMADIVARGPFGEAVSAGKPEDILRGLEKIRTRKNEYIYTAYANEISQDILRHNLKTFLAPLLQG